MKVNIEQAVASVIAYKQQRVKQTLSEQKQMMARVKNQKDVEARLIEKMEHANNVRLSRKVLSEIKHESEKMFDRSLKAFRKLARPARKKKPGNRLGDLASPHNIPGDGKGGHGTPAPQPEQEQLAAICHGSSIRCEGNSCDRSTSMIYPKFESSGSGGPLGLGASPMLPQTNSLFFLYVPAVAGTLNIIAEITLTGDVVTNTEPLYLLNLLLPFGNVKSSASAKLTIAMIIWQGNIIMDRKEVIVADLYSDDGSDNSLAFRDELLILNSTYSVDQGQWFVVEIRATGEVRGRSDTAHALIDFGKGGKANGYNYGIHVPQLCFLPVNRPVVNPL